MSVVCASIVEYIDVLVWGTMDLKLFQLKLDDRENSELYFIVYIPSSV